MSTSAVIVKHRTGYITDYRSDREFGWISLDRVSDPDPLVPNYPYSSLWFTRADFQSAAEGLQPGQRVRFSVLTITSKARGPRTKAIFVQLIDDPPYRAPKQKPVAAKVPTKTSAKAAFVAPVKVPTVASPKVASKLVWTAPLYARKAAPQLSRE